jgi:hypothetical protein
MSPSFLFFFTSFMGQGRQGMGMGITMILPSIVSIVTLNMFGPGNLRSCVACGKCVTKKALRNHTLFSCPKSTNSVYFSCPVPNCTYKNRKKGSVNQHFKSCMGKNYNLKANFII